MKRAFVLKVCFIMLSLWNVGFSQEDFYHPELNWRTIETEHFFVHYHDGTERTANVIAKIAEDIYEPVTSLYHHQPEQKISFVVKDYDDYSNGAAYFFDNKIEIWASALDFDLRGSHNWLRNVVTHEFTHIVQMQTAMKFGRRLPGFYFQWLGYERERRPDVLYGYPNVIVSYPVSGIVVPSWFAEGVAQYNRHELSYDYWDTHRDMILRMYALDDRLLTWNEMSVFGKTSLGNESSYNAGFAFVSYIAERYGEDKLLEISANLSKLTEVTIDGAIKRALGKSGEVVYNEWKEFLKKDYAERTKGVKESQVVGDTIAKVGFGNFYPTFSPDGKKLAYISNKEGDYFSLSSLYLYDLVTKKEKLLKAGVRSSFSWTPDGKKIYYSSITKKNPHWSAVADVYVYDIENEDEQRLTHGLRAGSPTVSPDGKTIAFVSGSDGTMNIFRMNIDGTDVRQLTHYKDGEQVFTPHWSPDGMTIIFDYSIKDGRDIATMSSEGRDVKFLLATPYDERNAIFTQDGTHIVYASDKSGIFNLYRRDVATNTEEKITNVLGGTFMPAVNNDNKIAFANYTSTGYKISLLNEPHQLQVSAEYVRSIDRSGEFSTKLSSQQNSNSDTLRVKQFDWQNLRTFNDGNASNLSSKEYKTLATSLSFIPFLRIDKYNDKSKGIDVIKPGLFVYSYDMLDRYGFFAGAAINRQGERDLFFNFDFRGKIPGLFQLGWEPALSLEAYNLTRVTDVRFSLGLDTLNTGVTYNLLEFDIALKSKMIVENLESEFRFSHSRYNASLGSFNLPATGQRQPAFNNLYYIGNDISATFRFEQRVPSRTMEINPVGRKIRLRYDFEFNKFNPSGDYEIANGLLVPKYQEPKFHRLETSWLESQQLPGWKHTLTEHIQLGAILGAPQDDFFDFYIGGLAGMKGYPFYSLGGNKYGYANITYRFPVFEHIDFRVLQMYFDKLYAAVYGDVGSAWSDGNPHDQVFRRDVGGELRLESFSYYAFPTRIFFNATYGLDTFSRNISTLKESVTYGREWNFHFGILFGFDLD